MKGRRTWALCLALGLGGCYQGVEASTLGGDGTADGQTDGGGDPGGESDGETDGDTGEPVDADVLERIGLSGLRRLTAAEYSATIQDLLNVDVDAELLLPEDWRAPFDNDYTTQIPGKALIDGAELLAADIAELAIDPARRDATVGCTPLSTADEVCFREFVTRFGRRALRRPLTETEIERFASLLGEATESDDFYAAVEVALRAFLQHPEFLYRVEIGAPIDGDPDVRALNDYEVATRLSYMLWGSTPDDALLDRAEAGDLSSDVNVREAAEEMFLDDRARARVGRFHALWMGYEQLPHAPDLAAAMHAETQALIDRVLFDDALSWQDLLRAEDTFVTPELAALYGIAAPAGEGEWVDYGDSGRRGLLSHGSFLSAAAKVNDTSPTQRGILVRTRLMCMTIPPPPPTVDVDNTEPEEGTCKEDFYRNQHLSASGCASCHTQMDPIGLGLENYDKTGAFRTVELDDPTCEISGEGDLDGTPFTGPAELSQLLIDSGRLNRCVTTQLYRFAMGRAELDDVDDAFIDSVVEHSAADGDIDFTEMTLAFVSDEAFRYRRNAQE